MGVNSTCHNEIIKEEDAAGGKVLLQCSMCAYVLQESRFGHTVTAGFVARVLSVTPLRL